MPGIDSSCSRLEKRPSGSKVLRSLNGRSVRGGRSRGGPGSWAWACIVTVGEQVRVLPHKKSGRHHFLLDIQDYHAILALFRIAFTIPTNINKLTPSF